MTRWCWIVLLAGCGARQKVLQHTWANVCPEGDPARAFLRFDADGTFSWLYPGGDAWTDERDERWALSRGMLEVSWNDGYAVDRFPIRGPVGRVKGTTTRPCPKGVFLQPRGGGR